jgi:hypothetical protein
MRGFSVISIHLPFLIKTLHRHSYTVIVHNFTVYEHICQHMNFKMQYVKHLSEITPEVSATAERGARFHPTVGSAIPIGFTTSHPRAETTMLRDCVSVFPVTENEGYSPPSLLSLPLCISRVLFLPSHPPPIASPPCLILLRGCVWHDFPRAGQA